MSDKFDILRNKYKLTKIDKNNYDIQDNVLNTIAKYNENEINQNLDDLKYLFDYLKQRENILEKYMTKKNEIKSFLEENHATISKNKTQLANLQVQINNLLVKNVELENQYNIDQATDKEIETLNNIKNINKNIDMLNLFLEELGIVDKK